MSKRRREREGGRKHKNNLWIASWKCFMFFLFFAEEWCLEGVCIQHFTSQGGYLPSCMCIWVPALPVCMYVCMYVCVCVLRPGTGFRIKKKNKKDLCSPPCHQSRDPGLKGMSAGDCKVRGEVRVCSLSLPSPVK